MMTRCDFFPPSTIMDRGSDIVDLPTVKKHEYMSFEGFRQLYCLESAM